MVTKKNTFFSYKDENIIYNFSIITEVIKFFSVKLTYFISQ